jgi:hypothetical protein
MDWRPIQILEIALYLLKAHNWKFPGNDQIQNYWLKAFPAIHRHIAKNFNAIIQEPDKAPDWLTTGITYLIPKSGDSKEVRNYRPITCLTTMHKTLTGIIAKEFPHIWKSKIYYQQSKKDVTLEVKVAKIN